MGEDSMTIVIDQGFNVSVLYDVADIGISSTQLIQSKAVAVGENMAPTEGGEPGMIDEGMMGAPAKDPLLSNWFFVIGISIASLVIGSLIGILLAKKKIKKGIEVYED
jgi:hypothetical protein